MPIRTFTRRGSGTALAASVVLPAFLLLASCAPSPVTSGAQRSPYERYDDLRGRQVPRTTTDSFGREKLNLEGRLGDAGRGG